MQDLGKWPRLVVAGDPVTPQQADSILIRTMGWNCMFANDKQWLAEVRAIVAEAGVPVEPTRDDYASHDDYLKVLWGQHRPAFDAFTERHGMLPWLGVGELGTDKILGNRGWCSWSGTIGCVQNIGKYPGCDSLLEDWQQIAAAFPYLRLSAEVTPEDGTHADAVRYEVAQGKAAMAASGHLPELDAPAAWYAEQEAVPPFLERGVTPDRLRQALRNALS